MLKDFKWKINWNDTQNAKNYDDDDVHKMLMKGQITQIILKDLFVTSACFIMRETLPELVKFKNDLLIIL
jgi:hypothetical protein